MRTLIAPFLSPPVRQEFSDPVWTTETDAKLGKLISLESVMVELNAYQQVSGPEMSTYIELRRQIRELHRTFTEPELEVLLRVHLSVYPTINPSFLNMTMSRTWMDPEGVSYALELPRFGVFSPSQPNLQVECFSRPASAEWIRTNFRLPEVFRQELYPIYIKAFSELAWEYQTFRLSFRGLIPETARRTIAQAANELLSPERVYLIREVLPEEWEINRSTEEFLPDPLIIGEFRGICYLFGGFDVTPLENYLVSEFTK